MRLSAQQNENLNEKKNYKIIAVDDEIGIIDSLSVFLRHSGYTLVGCTDPYEAIEKVKNENKPLEFTYEELMGIELKLVDPSKTYKYNASRKQ